MKLRADTSAAPVSERTGFAISGFEAVVGATAFIAAAAAVWLTLRADFLAHPGWLAAQKADVILGPVLTGLYWRRRRPGSRFGLVLIAAGLVCAPYLLQSSADPVAFSVGIIWEGPVYIATMAMILAFPSGRLDGVVARLVLAAAVVAAIFIVVTVMVAPVIGPVGSISGCASACPGNGLFVSAHVPLALRLLDVNRAIVMVNALVTIALIVHRFTAGTPPRRRALAIGGPIAIVFLLSQIAYQGANLFDTGTDDLHTILQWTIAATRPSVWYGYLLAIVAAELFAGRVLRRIVEASLHRPRLSELEGMLREPLGDPGLRLAFSSPAGWVGDTDEPVVPSPGRAVTWSSARGARPSLSCMIRSWPRSRNWCTRRPRWRCWRARTRTSKRAGTTRCASCRARGLASPRRPLWSVARSSATSTTERNSNSPRSC